MIYMVLAMRRNFCLGAVFGGLSLEFKVESGEHLGDIHNIGRTSWHNPQDPRNILVESARCGEMTFFSFKLHLGC